MSAPALIISTVALLVAVATAAALLEVYYRVQSLSSLAGISEDQRGVDLPVVGDRPSDHGLPPHLDRRSGVILFVSPRCETCHQVAASLEGEVHDDLYLVVSGPDSESCVRWLTDFDLDLAKATVDPGYQLADSMGVNTTPLAIVLVDGFLVAGLTVPSPQSLAAMLQGLTKEEAM